MQIILPFELIKLKVDKLYSPMNYCPLVCRFLKIQIILNIHSNLPWVYFHKMPGSTFKKILIKSLMHLSIISSDKIIVNSNFAKKELSKVLDIKLKKNFCKLFRGKRQKFKRK